MVMMGRETLKSHDVAGGVGTLQTSRRCPSWRDGLERIAAATAATAATTALMAKWDADERRATAQRKKDAS